MTHGMHCVMGLDMNLETDYLVDWTKNEEMKKLLQIPDVFKDVHFFTVRVSLIWWRKAYYIHRWFIRNVQNGVDDMQSHEVSRKQLQELLDQCRKWLVEVPIVCGDREWFLEYTQDAIRDIQLVLDHVPAHQPIYYRGDW